MYSLKFHLQDEEYVAENTDAFRVDENGFIIVNNTDTFDHKQVYEFYVSVIKVSKNKMFINEIKTMSRFTFLVYIFIQ